MIFTGYKKESPDNKVSESYARTKQYSKESFVLLIVNMVHLFLIFVVYEVIQILEWKYVKLYK